MNIKFGAGYVWGEAQAKWIKFPTINNPMFIDTPKQTIPTAIQKILDDKKITHAKCIYHAKLELE